MVLAIQIINERKFLYTLKIECQQTLLVLA